MKRVRFVKTPFLQSIADLMSCSGQTLFLLSQWVYRSIDVFPVCEGLRFNSAVSICVLSRCGFGVCRPETERSEPCFLHDKKELC